MRSFSLAIGALGCVAGLAACSVEATSPPVSFTPGPVTPPQPASKVMAIEGVWASNCYYNQGNYTKETTTFRDNTISIKVDVHYSSSCNDTPLASVKVDGVLMRAGVSFWVPGGHDVEVTIIQPDGTSKMERTVFLLENGVLFTSDSDLTTAGQWPNSVDRKKPLRFVGG